jgi:WD40 repeat protein
MVSFLLGWASFRGAPAAAAGFKELRRLIAHKAEVTSVAITPDGKTIASAGADRTVCLWDLATGKERRRLKGHLTGVTTVAFSQDGTVLASSDGSGTICLWDVRTGKKIRQFGKIPESPSFLAFTSGGKTLISAIPNVGIRYWDVATGKEVSRWQDPRLQAAALSPDGTTLATVATQPVLMGFNGGIGGFQGGLTGIPQRFSTVRFWSIGTTRELRPAMPGPFGGDIRALAFAPDGRILALGGSQAPVMYGFQGAMMPQFAGNGGLGGFAGLGGGIGGLGGFAGLGGGIGGFGGARKQPIGFGGIGGGFAGVQGRGIAGFGSGFTSFQGFSGFAGGVCFSLCEVATAKPRWQVANAVGQVCSVAFAPGGRTVATGMANNSIVLRETGQGKELACLVGHHGPVRVLAFAADGKVLVSASADGTIGLWDMRGLAAAERPPPARPSAEQLKILWDRLGEADVARAGQAMAELLRSPGRAVSLLRDGLRAFPQDDCRHIPRWIAGLDDRRYRIRRQATLSLERLGDLAGPSLREALASQPPSLELRMRLERLLARLEKQEPAADYLHRIRALEVLEQLGTAKARQALADLAKEPADTWLRRQAQASLHRVEKVPVAAP